MSRSWPSSVTSRATASPASWRCPWEAPTSPSSVRARSPSTPAPTDASPACARRPASPARMCAASVAGRSEWRRLSACRWTSPKTSGRPRSKPASRPWRGRPSRPPGTSHSAGTTTASTNHRVRTPTPSRTISAGAEVAPRPTRPSTTSASSTRLPSTSPPHASSSASSARRARRSAPGKPARRPALSSGGMAPDAM